MTSFCLCPEPNWMLALVCSSAGPPRSPIWEDNWKLSKSRGEKRKCTLINTPGKKYIIIVAVLIPPFCTYFGIKSAGRFAALILVIKVRNGIVGCAFWTNFTYLLFGVCWCQKRTFGGVQAGKSHTVKLDFQLPPALIACVPLYNLYTMMQSQLSQFLSTSLFDILVSECDIPSVGVNVIYVNAKYDIRRQWKSKRYLKYIEKEIGGVVSKI